jgi:hypothetical protein
MSSAQQKLVRDGAKRGRFWWAVNDGQSVGVEATAVRAVVECKKARRVTTAEFIVREFGE